MSAQLGVGLIGLCAQKMEIINSQDGENDTRFNQMSDKIIHGQI